MKRYFLLFLVLAFIVGVSNAQTIYTGTHWIWEDNFDDESLEINNFNPDFPNTYDTNSPFSVYDGPIVADANNPCGTAPWDFASPVFLGDADPCDPNDQPWENAEGTLSFAPIGDPDTGVGTELVIDLRKIVTELASPTFSEDELSQVSVQYDLCQTNGTGAAFRFLNSFCYYRNPGDPVPEYQGGWDGNEPVQDNAYGSEMSPQGAAVKYDSYANGFPFLDDIYDFFDPNYTNYWDQRNGGWRHAPGSAEGTSFMSLDGMGAGMAANAFFWQDPDNWPVPFNRLNRAQYHWQSIKRSFNADLKYATKIYQDPNRDDDGADWRYVAYCENWSESAPFGPWPLVDEMSLKVGEAHSITDGGTGEPADMSWFVDNIKVGLDNPYLFWDKDVEEDFNDKSYTDTGFSVVQGEWYLDGSTEPNTLGGTNENAPWGAEPNAMASADPNAYFVNDITPTVAGELVAVSFDITQHNGTTLNYPIFFGFANTTTGEYYVEYASPSKPYGSGDGASGFMVMKGDDAGNGRNPFTGLNDGSWSYDVADPNKTLGTGSSHIDMVFNPWANFGEGSVEVYLNTELVAEWTNFKGIESVDQVFFGMIENDPVGAPCWNYDNINIYTREITTCEDAVELAGGYLAGDYDQDCDVDEADLQDFAANWLQDSVDYSLTDAEIVNILDLSVFMRGWFDSNTYPFDAF